MKYKLIWAVTVLVLLLAGCGTEKATVERQAISIADRGLSLGTERGDSLSNVQPDLGSTTAETTDLVDPETKGREYTDCDFQLANEFEVLALNLVNQARVDAGVQSLTEHAHLNDAARQQSIMMACERYFKHQSPEGLTVEQRLIEENYPFIALGEIIAGGYPSPAEVVAGWINSLPHQDILLSDDFSEVGIGYIYLPDSEYGHYWTVVLARP